MIKLLLISPLFLTALIPGTEIYIENPPHTRSHSFLMAEVTAYTSSENETDSTPYLTAAQTATRDGVIACPRYIPFFTVVEIDSKKYSCEDRMALKHPDRWDIWMASYEDAIEFGIKKLIVKIYEN